MGASGEVRFCRFDAVWIALEEVDGHVGAGKGRADRVHANALGGIFERSRTGEAYDAVLGGRIDR